MPLCSSVKVIGNGPSAREPIQPAMGSCAPRPQGSTSTTHTWEYGEFVGPKQAVDFLNEPARQGRGEATLTPRKDGTVGLLYLTPGSLGISTAHTWYFKEYPAPHGVRDALTFLNAHPRQGEGEVSGYAHSDGSAVIFYLEPGSN